MPTVKPELKAKYRKAYYENNKPREIARALKWHRDNKERCQAVRKANRDKLREEVLDRFLRKCARCGYSNTRALQIDHVFGDGVADGKKYSNRATPAYLKAILADTEGRYQLLCANCNILKYFYEERPSPL
jgi:hypothetical protein